MGNSLENLCQKLLSQLQLDFGEMALKWSSTENMSGGLAHQPRWSETTEPRATKFWRNGQY